MKTKLVRLLLGLLFGAPLTFVLRAEEGGSGHYLPGSMASFIDAVPPNETFIVRLNLLSYSGSFSGQPLPFARFAAFDVNADSFASGLTLLWRPPIDLGKKWSFALSTTIPYIWLDVSAQVAAKPPALGGNIGVTVKRSGSINGVGDVVLMPLMLNYNFTRDFNTNFRFAIYAPTGEYNTGQLANAGKNFWTFEPTLALLYFGQKNGFEASLFSGFDFNTENNATNYQSGTQFHIDGTLAEHLPLLDGLVGAGATGYWYDQITGDSSAGAVFGDFKGLTTGVGPIISYITKIKGTDFMAELKWLHEVETRRRLEGDYIWFKGVLKF